LGLGSQLDLSRVGLRPNYTSSFPGMKLMAQIE
jgi:hypothetical protein